MNGGGGRIPIHLFPLFPIFILTFIVLLSIQLMTFAIKTSTNFYSFKQMG